ncbi:hypothetical protein CWI75_16465 [Kineobactrum sediminis]|uniref:Fatty acid hydroxylase domain-containing protein n=1 Tax=Kineobactrum sediminis TaxID=1905677 RepID=A0A2N5XYK7_9GAMM|nr:archaeosortase/exosortase family protein [Kineobactrum sediminis]PLW81227.1 hypothetical protein CWI75_16465 [Kineobactrum sediminis]
MFDYDSLNALGLVAAVAVLLVLERLFSRGNLRAPVADRWLSNAGLFLLAGGVGAFLLPESLTIIAAGLDGGLVRALALPLWVEVVVVFLLLDAMRYWEHRVLHEVPLLWHAHKIHHSDTAVDVSTSQRHHPLEVLLTTLFAAVLVFALGFSPTAFGIYIVVATVSAVYTHTSLMLPESIDRRLRRFLVTPAVHRIHHSAYQPETDSNYGAVLSVWDRLFGTYRDPEATPIERIGLEYFRRPDDAALVAVLAQPFQRGNDSAYAGDEAGNDEDDESVVEESAVKVPGPGLSAAWRRALLSAGIALILTVVALWPTVLDLTSIWTAGESYQFAWLVLPVFCYLVGWQQRERLLAMLPAPDYAGVALVLAGLLGWLAAGAVEIKLGQHLALVLILQGIALATLGRSHYRRLFPIFALLFFLVPAGDVLLPALRLLTLKWIEWFGVAAGLPMHTEGFVVHVGEFRYIVATACAGLGIFNLATFLGYSFGVMLFRSLPRILLLTAAAGALAILSNAVRVCLIVAMDWARGEQMDLAAHGDIQLVIFLLLLALLLLLITRLSPEPDERAAVPANVSPPSVLRRGLAGQAPLVAGLAIFVIAGGARGLAPATPAMALPPPAGSGEFAVVRESVVAGLNIASGQTWLEPVMIAGSGGKTRHPTQALAPTDGKSWIHTASQVRRECAGDRCIEFVHLQWVQPGTRHQQQAFYSYFIGEHTTASRLQFRLRNAWQRMGEQPYQAGLFGVRAGGGAMPATPVLAKTLLELHDRALDARHSEI